MTEQAKQDSKKKKKVAVLGGGIGALSAIDGLLKSGQDYDITLYQMGWRIGGKGASGRNMEQGYGKRIEEHGLHMWSGLYENAFRIMRQAYSELGRTPGKDPLATIDEAFKKHSSVVLMEEYKGQWKPWEIQAPTNDEVPGTADEMYLDLWDYVGEVLQLIFGRRAVAKTFLGSLFTTIVTILIAPLMMIAWGIYRLLRFIHAWWLVRGLLMMVLTSFMKLFWWEVRSKLDNDEVRRAWMIANTGFANLKGALDANVFQKGMDFLDDQDYKAWLSRYAIWDPDDQGQSYTLNGPLVQFMYDAQFSYLNGDLKKPNIGAGAALRTLIRMAFTWRGAILFKMQAGMGDVVFAPFYEVFERKGVKFRFFEQVRDLHLDSDGKSIERISMTQQATLKDQGAGYQPFVDVKGLPCWPAQPLWDQLEDGERLKREGVNFESYLFKGGKDYDLHLGQDFDEVIFAIPVGCIPYVAPELVKHNYRWKLMVDHLKTVRTQAFQTWWNRTGPELKVPGSQTAQPLISCYHPTPMNTMSDMTYLDEHEDWQENPTQPKSQYYYCGPMYDPHPLEWTEVGPKFSDEDLNQSQGTREAEENARVLMFDLSQPLLPGAWQGGKFQTDLLYDPNCSEPAEAGSEPSDKDQQLAAISWQYARANVNPQERFSMTNTGSTKYRIRPGDSGFSNLYLAGDWTDNSFNLANIEATVMSGMLCSRAMCQFPAQSDIIGLGFGCNPAARYG